jgi:RhtX/FptX family siderophore transporter
MIRLGMTITNLYLAQAIPLYFCTLGLPTVMRAMGVSLEKIGLFSLILFPWVIKFLWAPVVDNHYLARMGKRRSWIIPLQVCAILLLLLFTFIVPQQQWTLVFALALLLSTVGATQDIAIDGYTLEQVPAKQYAWGNFARVCGITLGSFLGGGLLIVSYSLFGWPKAIWVVIGLSVISLSIILFTKEQRLTSVNDDLAKEQEQPSLKSFWRRKQIVGLLGVCLIYRVSEGFVMGMQQPFLVDLQLPLTQIGMVMGVGSAALGILGAAMSSRYLQSFGPGNSLLVLGGIRSACYAGLAIIALAPTVAAYVVFAVVLINMASRLMEMVVLYTIFMQHCSSRQPGTDFTVFACAELLVYLSGMAVSGYLAANIGYAALFALGAGLSIPCTIVAVWFLHKRGVRASGSMTAILNTAT